MQKPHKSFSTTFILNLAQFIVEAFPKVKGIHKKSKLVLSRTIVQFEKSSIDYAEFGVEGADTSCKGQFLVGKQNEMQKISNAVYCEQFD